MHSTTTPLKIRLTPSPSWAAAVPESLAHALIARHSSSSLAAGASFPAVLQLTPTSSPTTQSPIFVAWSGDIISGSSTLPILEISHDLGLSLGLLDGTHVTVSVTRNVPVASRVYLQPTSPDDWDVVYLHAAALERLLLKSMSLVIPHLAIHLHLPAPVNTLIRVTIVRVEVSQDLTDPPCAFLAEGSEVAIAPSLRTNPKTPSPCLFRLLYSPFLLDSCLDESHVDAYVHAADWHKLVLHLDPSVHTLPQTASIQLLVPPLVSPILLKKNMNHNPQSSLDTANQPSIYLTILPAPPHLQETSQGHLLVIQPSLFNLIRGAIISLNSDLSSTTAGGLNCGVGIHGLGWPTKCILATSPDVSPVSHNSSLPYVPALPLPSLVSTLTVADPVGVLARIKSCFETTTTNTPVTIAGGPGTGKTVLSQAWLHSILQSPNMCTWTPVYVPLDLWIAPMSLDLARVSLTDLCRVIGAVAPAAVVLDGLDLITSSTQGDHVDESAQRSSILSRWIVNSLQPLIDADLARIILCVRDPDGVHPVLKHAQWVADRPRGADKLKSHGNSRQLIVLGEGGLAERHEILRSHLNVPMFDHSLSPTDLNEMATQTDGYSALDLAHLVTQAYHLCISQQSSHSKPIVTRSLIDQSLASYIPASLTTLKSSTSTSRSEVTTLFRLDQLGGLSKAKEILIETLIWPTKYPDLFAQVPIRIRQGVLLYGYPGVGKTALANTMAKHYNLRTIVVKGPELLDKYIGASEAGVRRVFAQARAAAPCMVFLDELDALAPRRGSDHAGVTDRVVNQLLTELDGAESMGVGVYVIGATSRPDLVDPALVRPGRLDKPVFCDMPNFSERIEILHAAVKGISMPIDKDIDWDRIADLTEGYSGADIHALLYNTSLEAIHDLTLQTGEELDLAFKSHPGVEYRVVPNDSGSLIDNVDSRTVAGLMSAESIENASGSAFQRTDQDPNSHSITTRHFLSALATTRPSVSPKLRTQLCAIYQMFSHSQSTLVPANQQRLTLK